MNIEKTNTIQSKLLTVKQLAAYLSVSEKTARRLLHEPNCPYSCRVGKRLYANRNVLDKWIDSRTGK